MPKMGESVSEATIISWTKEVGEMVELDETIVEIATVLPTKLMIWRE